MTLPVWISAAAAFVTAAVTRLVAPVWSLGPHGEAGTSFLQSVWANAADPSERKNSKTPAATSAVRAMIETPSAVKGTSRASMRGGSYAYAAAWSSPPALRRVKPPLDGTQEAAHTHRPCRRRVES